MVYLSAPFIWLRNFDKSLFYSIQVGPTAATCIDGSWSPPVDTHCTLGQHPKLQYLYRGKRQAELDRAIHSVNGTISHQDSSVSFPKNITETNKRLHTKQSTTREENNLKTKYSTSMYKKPGTNTHDNFTKIGGLGGGWIISMFSIFVEFY